MKSHRKPNRQLLSGRVAYVLLLAMLVLTVPWSLVAPASATVWGFPGWAFYSLAMTGLFALLLSLLLPFLWQSLASEGDDDA